MASTATLALACAGRPAARRGAVAARRRRLDALRRRFPGYSREALRHLLGSGFIERLGPVYELVWTRARRARRA